MNVEAVSAVFAEDAIFSPYMSFAPRLKPGIERVFPAIYHFDGSARPQTVTPTAGRASPEP
jgi:predicted NodU family carbamoyl transferase